MSNTKQAVESNFNVDLYTLGFSSGYNEVIEAKEHGEARTLSEYQEHAKSLSEAHEDTNYVEGFLDGVSEALSEV